MVRCKLGVNEFDTFEEGVGCALMKLIDEETGGVSGVWFIFSQRPVVVAHFRPARPDPKVAEQLDADHFRYPN